MCKLNFSLVLNSQSIKINIKIHWRRRMARSFSLMWRVNHTKPFNKWRAKWADEHIFSSSFAEKLTSTTREKCWMSEECLSKRKSRAILPITDSNQITCSNISASFSLKNQLCARVSVSVPVHVLRDFFQVANLNVFYELVDYHHKVIWCDGVGN